MMCPECGEKTKVTASRTINNPGKGWEMNHAKRVVGWYTQDFVVRSRACTICDFRDFTAELLLDDIKGIMQETATGHAPVSLTKKEREA
jgi:transcriptional regulator NrdR family protein